MNPVIAHNIESTIRTEKTRTTIFDDDSLCATKLAYLPFVDDATIRWFTDGNKYGKYRSDLCRLVQLYIHGGLYIDNDVQPIRSVELPSTCSFGTVLESPSSDRIVQSMIFASPNHTVVKTAIDYIQDFTRGERKVNGFLGPITMRDAIRTHGVPSRCMFHERVDGTSRHRHTKSLCSRAIFDGTKKKIIAHSRAMIYGDDDADKTSCYIDPDHAMAQFVEDWQHTPKRGRVVYVCGDKLSCGGTGDRLKGVTSLFLDAMRLGADFKIKLTRGDMARYFMVKPEFRAAPGNERLVVKAIDRGYKFSALQRYVEKGETVFVYTNRESNDKPIFMPFALWRFIGPVFRQFFDVSDDLQAYARENFPICETCVHARIEDKKTTSATFAPQFGEKVKCAKRITDGCVFLASTSDAFKRLYDNDTRVRSSNGLFKHIDSSVGSTKHGLAELLRLSQCRNLVFGGSGYGLAAHSIGQNTAFDHTCARKTGEPLSHSKAPFVVM